MSKRYDVAIIGGGIGGLMTAYELIEGNPELKICIIEKGKEINKRSCPITKTQKCVNCESCSIMNGMAGCGAFSDGKFILSANYGGWLQDYLGEELTNSLITQVDAILMKFGATEEYYTPDTDLELKCLQNGLNMTCSKLKHLGTDNNLIIMSKLIDYLRDKVDIITETNVSLINRYDLCPPSCTICCHVGNNKENGIHIYAKKVVIAVGRSGSNFLREFCDAYQIETKSNQVDIGVRVEMKDLVWKHFSDKIYEPKISYKTKTYEDNTRMFCFNQGGSVVGENTNGTITANGHSYSDNDKKTDNCNFAILSSIVFTEPFNNPIQYVENIAKLSNLIGDNNIIVQRFGDLIRGRRTTQSRLLKNQVVPTMMATPGDLSLVLPKRILDNIIETLYALDKIAPNTAGDDTLLYGCEVKYYSTIPKFINNNFEVMDNVYVLGDCSSVTRSLSQAGAMGLYVANKILIKQGEL